MLLLEIFGCSHAASHIKLFPRLYLLLFGQRICCVLVLCKTFGMEIPVIGALRGEDVIFLEEEL